MSIINFALGTFAVVVLIPTGIMILVMMFSIIKDEVTRFFWERKMSRNHEIMNLIDLHLENKKENSKKKRSKK